MFDFFKKLCSKVSPTNKNIDIEPAKLTSKTPLLRAIDSNFDIDYIKHYLEQNKDALYEFDDNFDVMCHAVSKLNYNVVDYLINNHNISWDYSTALFVLSNINDTTLTEDQKDRFINIYRLIVDKNGTKIFSGYEFLNAINKKNKTLIYLMILDGVFEERSCMDVMNKTELEVDIETNIFIKYFKNLYDNFKNLKELKEQTSEEVKEQSSEQTSEEVKEQTSEEVIIYKNDIELVVEKEISYCKNGVCPLIIDTDEKDISKAKEDDNDEEYTEDSEATEETEVLFVHPSLDNNDPINDELNTEEKLRENVEGDVLNKILEHMKSTVDNN